MFRVLSKFVATQALIRVAGKAVSDITSATITSKRRRRKASKKGIALATPVGSLVGAILMYLCDPAHGRTRRASVTRRMRGLWHTGRAQTKSETDTKGRSKGAIVHTIHRGTKKENSGQSNDQVGTTKHMTN